MKLSPEFIVSYGNSDYTGFCVQLLEFLTNFSIQKFYPCKISMARGKIHKKWGWGLFFDHGDCLHSQNEKPRH